ncbi:MAG TPA: hypothetical protein VLJ88_07570, partial [Propionibacteriaceae bacterium]|nr:hypothetical protein [Propionibacteriaceae bacterium]
NAWMDIAVAPTDASFTFNAAFINLTVVGPLANGYVFAYYPGPRPVGSSVNFVKGQTLSNAAFVALDVVDVFYAFRIFARVTTHVIADLSGFIASGVPGSRSAVAAKVSARRGQRAGVARRRIQSLAQSRR